MNHDRETLKRSLSSLPVPVISVLTMRSALRYLPAFLELQNAPRKPDPLHVLLIKQREEFATPLTRLWDWLDKTSRERDAADEKRMADRALMFRTFYACQTALFAIWGVTGSTNKAVSADQMRQHAGEATHKGIVLGALDIEQWEAMVRATVFAASSATTAALVAAGAPTPGSLEKQKKNVISAALGIAEAEVLAAELAADMSRFAATGSKFSASPGAATLHAEAMGLLSSPLWASGMPAEYERAWLSLKQKLLAMTGGFDLWSAWYANRLQGMPVDVITEAQWSTLSNAWFEVDPAHAIAELRALTQGGPMREPEPALLASARREKEARKQRQRRRRRSPSLLARQVWNLTLWRQAIGAAFSWGNVLPLLFATYSVISFLERRFGITLHLPVALGLDLYTQARESLFSWPDLYLGYAGLSVPGWLKDLSFIYFYVGGVTYWVLNMSFAPPQHVKSSFTWLGSARLYFALLWARIAWPWHFIGFYMRWVDPLRVYDNINPGIYGILRASRDGDGSQVLSADVTRDLNDSVNSIVLARVIPFVFVYLIVVAVTSSLVLFANAWLGH